MKAIKKSLALFLAVLMIFSSISALADYEYYNDGQYRTLISRFKFVDEYGTEITKASPGQTVYARVYLGSDFVAGATNLFILFNNAYLQPTNVDPTALTIAEAYNLWANKSSRYGEIYVDMTGNDTPGSKLMSKGFIPADTYDTYGSIYVDINDGIVDYYDIDEWVFQIKFTVTEDFKDDAVINMFVPKCAKKDNTQDTSYGTATTNAARVLDVSRIGETFADTATAAKDVLDWPEEFQVEAALMDGTFTQAGIQGISAEDAAEYATVTYAGTTIQTTFLIPAEDQTITWKVLVDGKTDPIDTTTTTGTTAQTLSAVAPTTYEAPFGYKFESWTKDATNNILDTEGRKDVVLGGNTVNGTATLRGVTVNFYPPAALDYHLSGYDDGDDGDLLYALWSKGKNSAAKRNSKSVECTYGDNGIEVPDTLVLDDIEEDYYLAGWTVLLNPDDGEYEAKATDTIYNVTGSTTVMKAITQENYGNNMYLDGEDVVLDLVPVILPNPTSPTLKYNVVVKLQNVADDNYTDGTGATNLVGNTGSAPTINTDDYKPAEGFVLNTTATDLTAALMTEGQNYTIYFDRVKYAIDFVNYDDASLQSTQEKYGATPVYNGATPTKPADADNTYAFASWTPAVAAVTGAATYKATFTPTTRTYKITWEIGDKKYYTENVTPGTTITAYTVPTTDYPEGMTFDKWTDMPATMPKADLTVSGEFKYIDYTITLVLKKSETDKGTTAGTITTAHKGDNVADLIAAYLDDNTITAPTGYQYEGDWTCDYETMPASGITAVSMLTAIEYPADYYVGDTKDPYESYYIFYGNVVDEYPNSDDFEEGKELPDGYKFVGWSLTKGEDGYGVAPAVDPEDQTMTEKGVSFYAIIEGKTYADKKIKFDANGGSFADDARYVEVGGQQFGAAVKTPDAEPTMAGKKFIGWAESTEAATAGTTADLSKLTKDLDDLPAQLTYYAIWASDGFTHKVTYHVNGLVYTTDFLENGETIENIKVDGKTVTWYTDTECKTAATVWTMGTANVDLYTTVADEKITVTFDPKGGKFSDDSTDPAEKEFTIGEEITYEAPSKVGYAFLGWDAVSDTLYEAIWQVKEYGITFKAGEDEETIKSVYGEKIEFPAEPDVTGYTFDGWYAEDDTKYENEYKDGDVLTFSEEPENAIVLVAKMTAIKYTIKFVDYNGTALNGADGEQVEYGTIPTAPANPTRNDDAQYKYTFDGWDPEIVAVTGDATYTATYKSTPIGEAGVTKLVAVEGKTAMVERDGVVETYNDITAKKSPKGVTSVVAPFSDTYGEYSSADYKTWYVYGLKTRLKATDLGKYVTVTNDGYYTLENVHKSGNVGTGTIIKVYDKNDQFVEQFYIIIFGDINGDGNANDVDDGDAWKECDGGNATWSSRTGKISYIVRAADLDQSGNFNDMDANIFDAMAENLEVPNQITGRYVVA